MLHIIVIGLRKLIYRYRKMPFDHGAIMTSLYENLLHACKELDRTERFIHVILNILYLVYESTAA